LDHVGCEAIQGVAALLGDYLAQMT
jgi:hypothetical protein